MKYVQPIKTKGFALPMMKVSEAKKHDPRIIFQKYLGVTCVKCKEDDITKLQVDHIVPVAKTGIKRKSAQRILKDIESGEDSHLHYQALCRKCNKLKNDKV